MRYFTINHPSELSLTACGQLISRNHFLHHRRNFEENVLILVCQGTLYLNTNNVNYTVTAGHYIFLKEKETHYGYLESPKNLTYFWIHFKTDSIAITSISESVTHNLYTLPEAGHFTTFGKTAQLFQQLSDLYFADDLHSLEMASLALRMLLLNLSKENMSKCELQNVPASIAGACDWICKNYYTGFTVASLAESYGYQTDYFSALFKKSMQKTVKEYVNQIRIRASKTLLANYDLSVKEIALSCGFEDEKYYMRVFKKTEQMTPTQYRKLYGIPYIN